MAYGGHPTALSGELSRHGARNSNTEIFENPIYESRPVYTRDRLRNVTDFLDGPVLRPENQRVILERLFEAKWDNAAEHRQRHRNHPDYRPMVIPRPSLGDIHGSSSANEPISLSPVQDKAAQDHRKIYAKGVSSKKTHAMTQPVYDVPPIPRFAGNIPRNFDNRSGNPTRSGTSILHDKEVRKGASSKQPTGALPVSIGGAPFTSFAEMSKELRKYPVRKDAKKIKKKSNLAHGVGAGATSVNASTTGKEPGVHKQEYPELHSASRQSRATGNSYENAVMFDGQPNPNFATASSANHNPASVTTATGTNSSTTETWFKAGTGFEKQEKLTYVGSAYAAPQQGQIQRQPKYLIHARQPPDGRSDAPKQHDLQQRRNSNLDPIAE